MEDTLDKKQLSLLLRLNDILKDPDVSTLLSSLEQLEPPLLPIPSPSPTLPTQPTLLQRMNGSISSRTSRKQSSLSELKESRKRPLSPQSSESSGRTLMSRLLNPKRSRLSTPISLRSSPSNLHSTSPKNPKSLLRNPLTKLKHRLQSNPLKVSEKHVKQSTPTTIPRETNVLNDKNLSNQTCLGTENLPMSPLATPVAQKPVGYCESSIAMSPMPNSSSKSLTTPHQGFPPRNGNESSKETQLTSTKFSHHSTILSLMKREQAAWVTRKSLLASLNRRNEFPLLLNGPQHGEKLPKQLPSLSPIVKKNSWTMEITSKPNLPPKSSHHTIKSSSTTLPCAMRLPEDNMSSSLTTIDSAVYTQPLLCPMESNPAPTNSLVENQENQLNQETNQRFAISSTPVHAKTPLPTVNTDISAKSVINQDTARTTARMGASEVYGLQPKYLRHNLWDQSSTLSPTTAEWSETARPLPRPPLSETLNPFVAKTIADHPDLFQVRTPIKVDVFESLLKDHPNPLFVKSVCDGLREGFWPWADTSKSGYPITHDESRAMPSNEEHASFIRAQCLKERDKGYYSRSFGTDLLPGMYSMPIHAVPKPHSSDLRLITDHSAGSYSLNSMIDHSKVTGFPLDNMRHLGEMLLDVRHSLGNVQLTLWKSDIADAYRNLPIHPLWQIKQIVTVDNERYVDHNLCFGSSSSPGLFISFNSLVAWIAKYIKLIQYLSGYMDDSSGCNLAGDVMYYEPYGKNLPSDQYRLLLLWDELGIPHKPHKQVFGSPLTIIGIDVDANLMTLTLPTSSKERLIEELRFWIAKPSKSSSGSFKLKYWERLAGWFNWALNVYPLLRPALNNVYPKIAGKRIRDQRVYINNAIRDDLMWAVTHIENSQGIHLFKSFNWTPDSADFVIFCDACPEGMGFWYPVSKEGYYAPTPVNVLTDVIFYFEALCVLSALNHVKTFAPPGSKILIYTDNANCVDIFRSLRCLPAYNKLLKTACDILIYQDLSLRVLHIPGDANIVADALSRVHFSVALNCVPELKLHTFNPPGQEGHSV